MSDPKNLSPKRAAQYAIFKAAQDHKVATINAIWVRAHSCCERCGLPVNRPGQSQTLDRVGSIVFDGEPSMDAQLRCQTHAVRR